MNEELTRVFEKYELEAMIEYYKNNDCSRRVAIELATALLEERAKPKDDVWEYATMRTDRVVLYYYEGNKLCAAKTYTRELPKTRARQIAEKIVDELDSLPRHNTDIEVIESILTKYAEELERKE